MSRLSEAMQRLQARGDWKQRESETPRESSKPDASAESSPDETGDDQNQASELHSLPHIAIEPIRPAPAAPYMEVEPMPSPVDGPSSGPQAAEAPDGDPPLDQPRANVKTIDITPQSAASLDGVFPGSFVIGDPNPPTEEETLVSRPEATHFERFVQSELEHAVRGEQYRRLWHNIGSDSARSQSRSILFVSTDDDDQRTLTSGCLAVHACSEMERSLLLVDAAAPMGLLSRKLRIQKHVGLTDVLNDLADLSEAVQPLSHEGLDVLPLGACPWSDATEINKALTGWMNAVKQAWQCVIIDGGRVDAPLAPALTRDCDVTYLLLRLGETTRETAVAAMADLRTAGGRVAGAIVTNAAA